MHYTQTYVHYQAVYKIICFIYDRFYLIGVIYVRFECFIADIHNFIVSLLYFITSSGFFEISHK